MGKSKVISFRLTPSEIEGFSDGIALSKNQSAFFKELILSKSPEKAAENLMKGTGEYERFNFLLYKTSNNINQIAKTLNILAKANFTDKAALNKALNNLHKLETNLKAQIL